MEAGQVKALYAGIPGCVLAALMVLAVVLTIPSPLAPAAPAPILVAAHTPKAVKGEYALGAIKAAGDPGYCLTYQREARNHTPVRLFPCVTVKGVPEAIQYWYLSRVLIAGRISVLFVPEVHVGQHGRSNGAVLADTLETPGDPVELGFYPIKDTDYYAISNIGYHNYVLTYLTGRRSHYAGTQPKWQRVDKTVNAVKKNQSWILPPWKPVE